MRRLLSLIAAAFSLLASPVFAQAPAGTIPVEAFARLPAISRPQLSPDGRHLAYLAARAGTQVIVVKPLTQDAKGREGVIAPDKGELVGFSFVKNDRILMNVRTAGEQVTGQTRLGSGTWLDQELKEVRRLVSVDLQGGDARMLTPVGNATEMFRVSFGGAVMHPLPESPDEVILQVQEDQSSPPSLARVNVRTGDRVTVQKSLPQVFGWAVGPDGAAVAGLRVRDEKDILMMRDAGGGWTETASAPMAAKEALTILPLSDHPDHAYVLARHETDSVGLYRYSGKEKRLLDRVGDWPADVTGLVMFHGHVAGVTLAGDMPEQVLFDPALRAVAAAIDKARPETRERLIDMSMDGTVTLFVSEGPGRPASYWLFNAREKQLYPLGESYPELSAAALPKRSAVSYPARDGRAIPAVITLPTGTAPRRLPFVVLPHGGPWSRDDLSFDWAAQFLASRGYGVIQPNFRGSTGHGYDHWQAGRGQWGRAMQDDLVDAAGWLAEQQLADAGRICIAGISYGGYAALVAAFRDAATFRCAASVNGIAELVSIYDSSVANPRDDARDSLGGNRTALADVSPSRQVNRFAMPVLLIHAERDTVVPVDHSVRLARDLKDAGKPNELLLLPGGSHWMTATPDRITVLKSLETFLARHLGTAPGG